MNFTSIFWSDVYNMYMKKILLTLIILFCSGNRSLAEYKLPDLGNPADKVLSADDEQRYRQSIKEQMHQYNFVMTDPVVASYIYHLGYKLAAYSGKPEQPFDFYMVPANVINASAYPGGLIVVYSGLMLETESESELAGVLAHEIAHVNQRHISRMMAKQQKSTVPILLGMLAAVVAAQSSNSGDAPLAIAASMSAIQQQLAINFTRYHEYEADRVGINTLYQAGLNPEGMASFFAKLMQKNRIDPRYKLPEYLRTHPLSVNRVTEAKNRLKAFPKKEYIESEMYSYVRERIRVMTVDEFTDLAAYYTGRLTQNGIDKDANMYGYAFYQYKKNQFKDALDTLSKFKPNPAVKHIVDLLKVQILAKIDPELAKSEIDKLLKWNGENETVLETTAQILLESKSFEWIDLAIINLRKLIQLQPSNPHFYDLLSIAYYNALKTIQSGKAMARKEHYMGRNYRAVRILRNLKKDEGLDYYDSAEINALIAEYEPLISDKERQEEIAADKGIGR